MAPLAGAGSAHSGTLCGQVTDRHTGAPIAQAAVILCDAEGVALGPVTATAADGSFCLEGLAPGIYVLAVRVDDYLAAWITGIEVTDGTTAAPIVASLPPFTLADPWPNPAASDVRFGLAVNRALPLRVAVHDLRGRLVRAWSTDAVEPGYRQYRWDGRDAAGQGVASGRYLLRVETRGYAVVRSILLNR